MQAINQKICLEDAKSFGSYLSWIWSAESVWRPKLDLFGQGFQSTRTNLGTWLYRMNLVKSRPSNWVSLKKLVWKIPTRFTIVMCWFGERIGYRNGWRTFNATEKGFEISAIAQPGSSQSKTKPCSSDYVTPVSRPQFARHLYLIQPPCVCGRSCLHALES